MCMSVSPTCIHVYLVSEEVRFPGTIVRDDWEIPYRCWEPNMGPERAASSLNC